jgi:Flp pilus assembly protein TadG
MPKLPSFARSLARRFRDDKSGVAIVEFALVLPIMCTLYLGCVAATIGVATDRKLTLLTHSLADLVAQDDTLTTTEMPDLFKAAKAVMRPYSVDPGIIGMRVSSVRINDSGAACVEWSVAPTGATKLPARGWGDPVTILIPSGLRTDNTYLIWSETEYTYTPIVGANIIGTSFELKGENFMRPRMADKVKISPDTAPTDCN